MTLPTDLEIAREARLAPIELVAADMGIDPQFIEQYGKDVAKIDLDVLADIGERPAARYVVVTAMTPTPLGEGKTTVSVGLGQAFRYLSKRAVVAIRQPSMGPTFGIKGGAAGGGYSQVVPMESLNLHLTGDMHAVTSAHNLLSAVVDNHLFRHSAADLDVARVMWRRVLDVNDRALRNIVVGLGARVDGIPRQAGFDITPASEVMAVLALAGSLEDLRARIGRIVVGSDHSGQPVTAEDLEAAGAMAVILRDAIKPNLLQTLEGTPVLVHAGPFANIAHGNSSVVADLVGIRGGDFLITEAGFGSDMGAERFFNLKCRVSGLVPDAAVIVATVRALKAHSGKHRIIAGRGLPAALLAENPDDVYEGADNLRRHIEIVREHGVTPVVAINAFPSDHPSEHKAVADIAESEGARAAVADPFTEGGKGVVELAEVLTEAAEEPSKFEFLYPANEPLRDKIETIAERIYGAAGGVAYSVTATRQLEEMERLGYRGFSVCIAKTNLSLSADPMLMGAPTDWMLPVREVRAAVGAGFIVPICGDVRLMPGLGSSPALQRMDLDEEGQVVGLS